MYSSYLPFRVMIADPPWLFGDKLPGESRGASNQYQCMTVKKIRSFTIPQMHENSLLLLWRVSSMQEEALSVARAWNFKVKSEIVWEKLTKNGKPWFGMGHYVRASHETCLVCVRGSFKVSDRAVRSVFSAKAPVDGTGKYIHSAKPPEFHAIAEKLAGRPGVELFARRQTPGWVCLGNEVEE